MADPLTILLFVASGEGSDATTRAMLRATRDALGPGASVEVRETTNDLTDDDALIAEQLSNADAVVDLAWSDVAHRNARLRVHVARSGRWISRFIGFMASDASKERGRTIGFAVVSMLPDAGGDEQPATNSPTPLPRPIPSSPTSAGALPAGGDRTLADYNEAPARAPSSVMSRFALDLFALGAKGIGGKADAGGGAVGVSWYPWAPLSLRLGGSVRAGSIDGLPSSTLTATASAGVAWHPVRSTLSHPFGVSLRAEYVLLYQSMQYFLVGASAESQHGWLSGLAAVVEPAWLLAPDVDAVLGLELEDVFVPANVLLRGVHVVQVATVPPLRGVVEIGVRVRF